MASLRTKLLASVLIVAGVAVGVGLLSLQEIERVSAQGRSIYTSALVPDQTLSDLRQNVVQARFDVLSRANAASPAAAAAANLALRADEANVTKLTASYAVQPLSAAQEKLLATFNRAWLDYKFVRDDKVTPALLAGNLVLYEKLRTTELVPLVNEALGALTSLNTLADNGAKASLSRAAQAASTARTAIWLLLAFGILLCVGLAWMIANAIMRPVREVRDILDAVAQNDLTRIADVRTSDELGQMASALNTSISHLRSLHEELSDLASHDNLTGLPNRAAFMTGLDRELRDRPGTCGVLFIDLDGFKAVNDVEGHAVGDALLVAVSVRMSQVVRAGDVVARLGGDEFVVICIGLESPAVAAAVSDRIIEQIEAPFQFGSAEITIGASIGISLATSQSTSAELLKQADMAMYRSKSLGKSQRTFFEADMLVQP